MLIHKINVSKLSFSLQRSPQHTTNVALSVEGVEINAWKINGSKVNASKINALKINFCEGL